MRLAPFLLSLAAVTVACSAPIPVTGGTSAATAAVDVDEVSLEISALM